MTIGYQNMSGKQYYDRRIEWLESDGNQWIDTGLMMTEEKTDLEVQFMFTGLGGNNLGNVFGAMSDDNEQDGCFCRCYRSLTKIYFEYPIRLKDRYMYIKENEFNLISVKCNSDNAQFMLNDSILNTTFLDRQFMNNTLYVFAAHTNNGVFRPSQVRIKHFKYGDLDLVPVRFTNENGYDEGAMFDEVSKKLFRNIGSGAFKLGPDLKG